MSDYIQLVLSDGSVVTSADGATLFQVSGLSYGAAATGDASATGAGAGKVLLDPLSFTLGSGAASQALNQALASGVTLKRVVVYGAEKGPKAGAEQIVSTDTFAQVAVGSVTVDAATGANSFTLAAGGISLSTASAKPDGTLGTAASASWNLITATPDASAGAVERLAAAPSPAAPGSLLSKAGQAASEGIGADEHVFVRLLDAKGKPVGGGDGWVEVEAAATGGSAELSVRSQDGTGAGKVAFAPLSVTLDPGALGPTLFKDLTTGAGFSEIEVATYGTGNGSAARLTADYRFGTATLKSVSAQGADGGAQATYTFDYGQHQTTTYEPGPSGGSAEATTTGWNSATDRAETDPDALATKAQQNSEPKVDQYSGSAVCFCTGTRILTARGEVEVEALRVGDLAVTSSGECRPVRWIGHRDLGAPGQALPFAQRPVRVLPGAFGPGLPSRTLYLSPGHPVLVGAGEDGMGGHLVPVMCLINGTTVERERRHSVTYWHVELDRHDILLAEGLGAESYLDGGDRAFFDESADHALLDPDFVAPGLGARCRPVALDGPVVEAERHRLDAAFVLSLLTPCAWPTPRFTELGF